MTTLGEYLQKAKDFGRKIDESLIRTLFNRFYDSKNACSSSRMIGIDYHLPGKENPLATSFCEWDYLLDGFGSVSKRDSSKMR